MSAERPTPRELLHSLRPRRRDIPFDEQAAILTRPGSLPLDLRMAIAVTFALGSELEAMTEEHRADKGKEPYRVDLFDALGQRVNVAERTLRRIHGGLRWPTVPEIARMLEDAGLGSRLAQRLRLLDVDLLSARPNMAQNGELPAEPENVEDMHDDYGILETEVRERVRILASQQAVAAANHLPRSETNWLAVEGLLIHHWPATPRVETVPEQLQRLGMSLAGLVREVLGERDVPATVGTILASLERRVRQVQSENDLPLLTTTRHQVTDALKYLRGRGEVVSLDGQHCLATT